MKWTCPVRAFATAIRVEIDTIANPNGATLGSGGDITGNTLNWLVGQYANVEANVQAPAAWRHGLSYDWVVPGNVLWDYFISSAGTGQIPLRQSNGDSQLGTLQAVGLGESRAEWFWVSTDFGRDMQSYNVTLDVGKLDGRNFTAAATFNVSEPVTSLGKPTFDTVNITNGPELRAGGMVGQAFELPAQVTLPQGFPDGAKEAGPSSSY